MNTTPIAGALALWRGLRLLNHPLLRPLVVLPVAISLVAFAGLAWLAIHYFEAVMAGLLPEGTWLDYLRWLLWPLFAIALVLVFFYGFAVIANLVAAPFNDLLAERTRALVTGSVPTGGGWREALRDAPRAIGLELRKLNYFIWRALPLLVLFLIPGLNLFAPPLWLAFTAWYMALEYASYPLTLDGRRFGDQLGALRGVRYGALGFGGSVLLLMAVPLLNLLAMPAAVVGATLWWNERR